MLFTQYQSFEIVKTACEYSNITTGHLSNILICTFNSNFTINKGTENIAISNLRDQNNIQGFYVFEKNVSVIPSKVGQIFPILKSVVISNSHLKVLTANSLNSYPHLEFLNLVQNEIAVLEKTCSNSIQN